MSRRSRVSRPDVARSHPALPSTPGQAEHGLGLAWDHEQDRFCWASMGGGGTPASSVESETTWGIQPAVGVDIEYARQDHTHGSPGLPAHPSLASLAWPVSGHTGGPNSALVAGPGGEAAEVSGLPGQVLGWDPTTGELTAVFVAAVFAVLAPTLGCVSDEAIGYPAEYATYYGGTIT